MPPAPVARLRENPMILDALFAVLLLPFVWASAGAFLPPWLARLGPISLVVAFGWALAYLVPLAWRRTAPDAAAAAIIPAHLVQLTAATPQVGNITVPIMMYAVAAYGRERWSRGWLTFGLIASLIAGLVWTVRGYSFASTLFGIVVTAGGCAAVVAAAWYMGSLARSRRARVAALADRADALHREQVQHVRLAATEERQRIAREMHDIVAHSLSIIVVQADGARYLATEGTAPPEERLARAAQAIETIQGTARSALAETRRLVGVLHSDAEGAGSADLAPAETITDIPRLVANVTAAGRDAELTVGGDPASHAPLGPVAELTAYRIVQESLTNVMKHAGPGASVDVRLTHSPLGLTVLVRDNGVGATASDGLGHGIAGMRARIEAVGGTLDTRSAPFGGFEVHALIPAPHPERNP